MYDNYFTCKYDNYNLRPYGAKNILNKKIETSVLQQPVNQSPATENIPQTGFLSVEVLSSLSSLPVKGAVVTIYHNHEDGREHVHNIFVTDENGKIPEVELPVRYSEMPSMTNFLYHYSTYSLRVAARNYYTKNILNFEIFPSIKTNYIVKIDPVSKEETGPVPENTIVIPPSPIKMPTLP